jgi:hypothetical protein
MRIFGAWSDYCEIRSSWQVNDTEPFPSESEVLFASYGGAAYEGDALVIFERDGKLYEVNGYHCSCYGLEGQWSPEETTWEALAERRLRNHDNDAIVALAVLVNERTKKGTP